MRDVLLALVVAVLSTMALRRPEIGVYLWTWVSMMNPHTLTYGFARTMPIAQIAAVVTLLGLVFTKQRKALPINGGTVLLLLLVAWMTLTSAFALNQPELVWDRWLFGMKIFFMLFLTLMILRGRDQIDRLIWVIVASIGFYGVKGGVWTLLTGGGGRVWGPPGGMLAGNNELAIALVVLLPWMYYLHQTASKRWVRYGLLASMVVIAFAILGTQSRGALLALLAMAVFLGLKGAHPVRTTLALLTLVGISIAFMPDTWSDRMETLGTYQEDSSAMSRIYTWRTLWNAALDRPLVGAGFTADNPLVFALYAPRDMEGTFVGRVWVAHSIYFQALGEHGFPGLLLYVGIGAWIWRAAGRLARSTVASPAYADWVPLLMRMCQVSLVGFAVGGAFLSLMLLDLPYYILAVVVLTGSTISESAPGGATKSASAIPASPPSRGDLPRNEGSRPHG